MKKHLFLLLFISPFFLGACNFSWSNKIPDTVPPSITMPEEKEEEEEIIEEEVLPEEENTALKYEVILPSEERKTERLLEEYQEALENIESNLE